MLRRNRILFYSALVIYEKNFHTGNDGNQNHLDLFFNGSDDEVSENNEMIHSLATEWKSFGKFGASLIKKHAPMVIRRRHKHMFEMNVQIAS